MRGEDGVLYVDACGTIFLARPGTNIDVRHVFMTSASSCFRRARGSMAVAAKQA